MSKGSVAVSEQLDEGPLGDVKQHFGRGDFVPGLEADSEALVGCLFQQVNSDYLGFETNLRAIFLSLVEHRLNERQEADVLVVLVHQLVHPVVPLGGNWVVDAVFELEFLDNGFRERSFDDHISSKVDGLDRESITTGLHDQVLFGPQVSDGMNASTGSIATLEDAHLLPPLGRPPGCISTASAGADDGEIALDVGGRSHSRGGNRHSRTAQHSGCHGYAARINEPS
mmetsp:Transcript_457/g.1062  ORF Transcript_457/g.1062 Transcript_457/m.1062 type:complete len:227 (-) Transcript_457:22-702(-)